VRRRVGRRKHHMTKTCWLGEEEEEEKEDLHKRW